MPSWSPGCRAAKAAELPTSFSATRMAPQISILPEDYPSHGRAAPRTATSSMAAIRRCFRMDSASPIAIQTATRHCLKVIANTTIIDVSEHAGVSIKTVSRVINNVQSVRAQIRERVLRAIEKLDYHPNPSARGLGGNRSYMLGLLYDISCGYYATSVLAGVSGRRRAAKYQLLIEPS